MPRACLQRPPASLASTRGRNPGPKARSCPEPGGLSLQRLGALNLPADIGALCQPDERRACGGCCNDFSRPRPQLARRLRQRASLLRSTGTSPEGLERFKARVRAQEPGLNDCPFLGFLDAGERRAGCLIHPARFSGRELRDCGKYDSRICAATWCHFADSLTGLDETARRLFLLLAAEADWYDYSRLLSRFVSYRQSVGLFAILCDYTRPLFERLLAFRPGPRGFLPAYLRLVEEAARALGRALPSHHGRVIAGISFSAWRLFGLRFFREAAGRQSTARRLDEALEGGLGRFALG